MQAYTKTFIKKSEFFFQSKRQSYLKFNQIMFLWKFLNKSNIPIKIYKINLYQNHF